MIGVIDYATLEQTVMPAFARPFPDEKYGKDGNFDLDRACILKVNVKFFRLDPSFTSIKPNAHLLEGIFKNPFVVEDSPQSRGGMLMYPENCTPFYGCG